MSDLIDIASQILDTQGGSDDRNVYLERVGVKGVKFPIVIRDRDSEQKFGSVGDFEMYASLNSDERGTHMSRFMEILHSHGREISVENFNQIVLEIQSRLKSHGAHLKVSFPFFRNKAAPVSGIVSLMDYEVELECVVLGDDIKHIVTVHTYGTSLCPCSKEISEYGAHNQRSKVTISVSTRDTIWIEDLIDIAEEQMSCQVYGVLKRPDEKYVTEHAYDNPKFVEDMVRDLALSLKNKLAGKYLRCNVEAENFESIHNHNAYGATSFKNPLIS